jgi:hypothetical protein
LETLKRDSTHKVQRDNETWKRIKSLVLDGVTSPHSKRAYAQALDAFERWCAQTGGPGGHLGFTKATVQAWRMALESASLAASSILDQRAPQRGKKAGGGSR